MAETEPTVYNIVNPEKLAGKETPSPEMTIDEVIETTNRQMWGEKNTDAFVQMRKHMDYNAEIWGLGHVAAIQNDLHDEALVCMQGVKECQALSRAMTAAIAMCEKYREEK